MGLTHLNSKSNPTMVDISDKSITKRRASASGKIFMNSRALSATLDDRTKKGSVINTAIIAGIMAAKNTSSLIPLCHNIALHSVDIEVERLEGESAFVVKSSIECEGKTGAEMEALVGCNITLLTMYDMLKALDKGMIISDVYLESKSGGKSGDFKINRI